MAKTSYPKEVDILINNVVLKIADVLKPDYILIAGSFGKKSWLFAESQLISDFEFVFVCRKKWSLKKKKQLLRELNAAYSHEISLKGYLLENVKKKIHSNYERNYQGYVSLDFFDTFSEPQVLYSKNNDTLQIGVKNIEIPVWEAWRLYVNRMGDLLTLHKKENHSLESYYWLKIFESTADTYLLNKKLYHKNISSRREAFSKELLEGDKELSELCKHSFTLIEEALTARENHLLEAFTITIDQKKLFAIVNSWMTYFEKKLITDEGLSIDHKNFFQSYVENKKLQKKYLEKTGTLGIVLSNYLRLFKGRRSLSNVMGKYLQTSISYRHLSLLCVSSAFKELTNKSSNLEQTSMLFSFFKEHNFNRLSNDQKLGKVIEYWKIFR